MNNYLKKIVLMLSMLIVSVASFAQDKCERTEMADGLYQSGKIYVVVTVIAIIFTGIIVYLVLLDRKIGKLEKEINSK